MKKIAVLLAIALVLGVSLAAYAGAKKYVLEPTLAAPGASGFVIIHYVKEEKTIGQIQVRGLVPGMYEVMVGSGPPGDPLLGTIEVKKNGSGHLHVVRDDAEPTTDPFTINIVDGSSNVVLFASIPSFP